MTCDHFSERVRWTASSPPAMGSIRIQSRRDTWTGSGKRGPPPFHDSVSGANPVVRQTGLRSLQGRTPRAPRWEGGDMGQRYRALQQRGPAHPDKYLCAGPRGEGGKSSPFPPPRCQWAKIDGGRNLDAPRGSGKDWGPGPTVYIKSIRGGVSSSRNLAALPERVMVQERPTAEC